MTILDCSATSCIYNSDKCCCKGDIKVEGRHAERTEDTCCGSFEERSKDSMRNAAGHMSREIDVTCEACHCVFNDNKKCSADHIGIVGQGACKCSDTECGSFQCRCSA